MWQPYTLKNEGLWEGYDGEWSHASRQLIALAEATPPQKFAWRPAPEVRSIGEVYMHIAIANFYLLSVTGAREPEVSVSLEKTVTQKADVLDWLKRSLDAVAAARAHLKPGDLQRKVSIELTRPSPSTACTCASSCTPIALCANLDRLRSTETIRLSLPCVQAFDLDEMLAPMTRCKSRRAYTRVFSMFELYSNFRA